MIKYLWYLSPAGAIQKEVYYQLINYSEIIEIDRNLIPKFSPYEYYKQSGGNYCQFDEKSEYPLQNGYVFDFTDTNGNEKRVITYADKGKLFLLIDNDIIVINDKSKIKCKRILNYCNVKLILNELYNFTFFFPFYYLFLHDGIQSSDECSPFFFLMKQWEIKTNRNLWISSWESGVFTDRWVN